MFVLRSMVPNHLVDFLGLTTAQMGVVALSGVALGAVVCLFFEETAPRRNRALTEPGTVVESAS